MRRELVDGAGAGSNTFTHVLGNDNNGFEVSNDFH